MAKLKVDQFVDLVKRSGLVDDERLSLALSGIDESVKDSGIIASNLTKAGLLTEWQSEKLLQGKHKGFYLGKYKLLNHIGTGGMGSVYLAEHRIMRHRVAIKLLPNHLAAHPSYLERFHQEARASASLNHPNMVRAHDVDHEENIHFLVMEYVDGCDLQAVVSRNGPLPYRLAANYTRQAAQGLSYVHISGLIHRDIKPANLLVDQDGTVKILDMGLARFTDQSQASLTMAYDQKMIGTVDYLAPEQALDSHRVDARVDIYSLGCTLYFMLTGDAPFPQGTIPQRLMLHQTAEPADVRATRPDAPAELLAICRKMMAKSPDDRYQNAEEVSQALSLWLGDGETPSRAPVRELPPDGPSQNEDLTLAPLDEEPRARGASGSGTGSKSKINGPDPSGATSGKSSGGHKTVSPATKNGTLSGINKGKAPPANGTGSTSVPAAGLQKLDKPEDLMDELLAGPPPLSPEHSQSMPLTYKSHHTPETQPLWMLCAMGLAGGVAVFGIIVMLIWYWYVGGH